MHTTVDLVFTLQTESEFFAADDGELERDKENLRADPPSSGRTQPSWKATSTRPEDDFVTPNRAATLVEQPNVFDFGVEEVEEVGEGEEEEERRARDDLLEEMGCHQPTISGKLLERQQLIQQIVASCLRTAGCDPMTLPWP